MPTSEFSINDVELAVRRLRYRLNRQGMLELDAWLAPLLSADFSDATVLAAAESLLSCEPPELQRLMQGGGVPEVLRPWLRP